MDMEQLSAVELSPEVHWLHRGKRLFLIEPESLGWLALPVDTAPALELCDGRPLSELEAAWPLSRIPARKFVEQLRAANLLRLPSQQSAQRKELRDKPQAFILKLTEKCNMSCTYCYDEAGRDGGTHMSMDTFRKAVDFAFRSAPPRALHFHFHGGEPLSNWPVFTEGAEYIRERARQSGRTVSLSTATNGLLLTEEKIQFLSRYPFAVRLSFDGLPELHDLYRKNAAGQGTAAKVLNALRLMQSHPEMKAWCVLSTITGEASSRIPEIVQFLQDQGVPSAEFLPCRLQGHAEGKEELKVRAGQFIAGLKDAVALIESGRISSLRVDALMRLMMPLLTSDFIYGNCGSARCGAGKDLMVIEARGTLRPCDVIPKTAFAPLGDVRTGQVSDFSEELLRASAEKAPDCKTCPWLKPCRGGCPGSALTDDGNFFAKHGFACELHLEMYPFLMERLCASPALGEYFSRHYSRKDALWMPDEA